MAEVVGRVPETEVWGVELPFHWRNQLWQGLEKGYRKARFGVWSKYPFNDVTNHGRGGEKSTEK